MITWQFKFGQFNSNNSNSLKNVNETISNKGIQTLRKKKVVEDLINKFMKAKQNWENNY